MKNDLEYKIGYSQARIESLTDRIKELDTQTRADLFADEGIREVLRVRAWQAAGTKIMLVNDSFVGLPAGVPEGFDLDEAMETFVADRMDKLDVSAVQPNSDGLDEPVSPAVKAFREGLG